MMLVAMSNAGRIPRSYDGHRHDNFPNLQTVHHGHGATSYQNIDIKNHGEISIPTKFHTSSHHYVYPEEHDHGKTYCLFTLITERQFNVPHTKFITCDYCYWSFHSVLFDLCPESQYGVSSVTPVPYLTEHGVAESHFVLVHDSGMRQYKLRK